MGVAKSGRISEKVVRFSFCIASKGFEPAARSLPLAAFAGRHLFLLQARATLGGVIEGTRLYVLLGIEGKGREARRKPK